MTGPIAEFKLLGLRLQLFNDRIVAFKAWSSSSRDVVFLNTIGSVEFSKARGKLKITFSGGEREWDGALFDGDLEKFTNQLRDQIARSRQPPSFSATATPVSGRRPEFCTSCGSSVSDQEKFCAVCGNQVLRGALPTQIPETQVPQPLFKLTPVAPTSNQSKPVGRSRLKTIIGLAAVLLIVVAFFNMAGNGGGTDDDEPQRGIANPTRTLESSNATDKNPSPTPTRPGKTATTMPGNLEILDISTKDAGTGDSSFYAYVDVVNHSDRLYAYVGLDGTCRNSAGQVVATGLGNTANVAAGEKVTITMIFLNAEGCDKINVKFDALTGLI